MNIKEVKDLINDVLQSDISEFELEDTGTRVRLKRGFGHDSATASSAFPQSTTVALNSSQPGVAVAAIPPVESTEASEDNGLHVVTSPIVGTFYSAPSPGAEPYVKLGDKVEEGSILCLIEAMKLMNEIPSDMEGDVARIYVENGHPVEFGQKLFGIRPRKQG
jgi:acetyl-CoA carboxylase biotin carboxyl carrier protein